jgi:hypothetical protein
MRKPGIRIAAVALAAGVVTITQLPALAAAPSTSPAITIAATSHLRKVTGDVSVVYQAGKYANASISGTVTGAASGDVLRLLARQFPYKKAAAPLGSPVPLTSSASTPYSFTVTPTLATRYEVELFATATSTTPLASSAVSTVYVEEQYRWGPSAYCSRTSCHYAVHLWVIVPPSALKAERTKRWFVYFGLRFSASGTLLPKTLRLGAAHIRVSRVRKLSNHEYEATITFSYTVPRRGRYQWEIAACQKNSEAKDGLNLPGKHGCGNKLVSGTVSYLGTQRV